MASNEKPPANQDRRQPAEQAKDPSDTELSRADDLIQRTRAFFENCVEDPNDAFERENPDVLREELNKLGRSGELEELPKPRKGKEDGEPPVERRRTA